MNGSWLKYVLSLLLVTLLPVATVLAQSPADGYRPDINGGDVLAVAVQADGKAVIGGTFTSIGGVTRNRLARLNPDGSLDTGFNPDVDDAVLAVAIQSNGRILIGGTFSQVGGQPRPFLAWLNANGTLRSAPAAPSNTVSSIVTTESGFVIGGNFFNIGGNPRQGLAAYLTLGTQPLLVSSFPTANNSVFALARDNAGRIVVGGLFTQLGGQPRARLARIDAGVLDPSFNPGADSTVSVLAVHADDSVVVGGAFNQLAGQPRNRLGRIRADGSLDPGFAPVPDGILRDALVQPDGGIVLGGEFAQVSGVERRRVARLHADGSVDLDFEIANSTAASFAAALAVQPDGKLLVGGHFPGVGGQLRNKVLRLYGNGRLDNHYTEGLTSTGFVWALAVDASGRTLVGGNFVGYADSPRTRLARLLVDGRLDPQFTPNIAADSGFSQVEAIAVLEDESMVIGGGFTQVGGLTRNRLARLNAAGELVVGYAPNANDFVTQIVRQPPHAAGAGVHPGGVLVAGAFTSISGLARNKLARILDDGSVDPNFNPNPTNGAIAAEVKALTLQANGDIVVGGFFNAIAGQTRHSLARLRPTGAIDLGFAPTVTAGDVLAVLELPDGRLLIGGDFAAVNGSILQRLARLNANGSLDSSFTIGANDRVRSFLLLRDGSVVVAGDFTQFGGLSRNRVARLRADGTVDPNFNPDANGATVRSLALLPDGKVVMGGNFSVVDGLSRSKVARLAMPAALLQSLQLEADSGLVRWNGSAGFPALSGSGPGSVDLALSIDGENYLDLAGMQADAEGWSTTLPAALLPRGELFHLRARGRHRQVGGNSNLIDSVRQFYLPITDRIFADGFQ